MSDRLATVDREDSVTPVVNLDISSWRPNVAAHDGRRYADALESGAVLVLPKLAFEMSEDERRFLDVRWSDGKAKNISVEGDAIRGASGQPSDLAALSRLITRFATLATTLVLTLFPLYAPHLQRARTSFRPHAATGRAVSWRKDDTRLHVDAFPSRPSGGERILRVFCNVNPLGEMRVWRVGESFEAMAQRFLPRVRAMYPGEAEALALLHATKGRRSKYDHLMLGLHDCAKADLAYQSSSPQREVCFAPGTTWICFSDQVMHAAMSGQYMMEQTAHLPLAGMYDPARSPLAILEGMTGRALAARPSADESLPA